MKRRLHEDGRPMTESPSVLTSRLLALLKILLLAGILSVHFLMRLQADRTLPLAGRPIYGDTFVGGISMAAGYGFRMWEVPENEDTRALREFLNLQRESLTATELQQAIDGGAFRVEDTKHIIMPVRRLDVFVAGAIWSLRGIHWHSYFAFYLVVSTLSCLLVGLIAKRLCGSDWPGLLACLVVALSPFEATYTAFSTYHVNPTWFMTLGFFGLCYVGRPLADGWRFPASWAAAGALCYFGRGWRPDVSLLFPYAVVVVAAQTWSVGRSWKSIGVACLSYIGGALLMLTLISHVGPSYDTPIGAATHVAVYGDALRENLLHVEDVFGVPLNDEFTYCHVEDFYYRTHGGLNVTYMQADYGRGCTEHYLEQLQYQSFRWWAGFPHAFITRVLDYSPLTAAPTSLSASWPPPLQTVYLRVVRTMQTVLPWLFLLGAVATTLLGPQPILAGAVSLFAVYYGMIFFLVLPEDKHMGPLLVPLAVMAAGGVWTCLQFIFSPRSVLARAAVAVRLAGRRLPLSIATMFVAWWGVFAVASQYSAGIRATYISEVLALAAHGTPAPETIVDPHLFMGKRVTGSTSRGYLLKIRAADHPGSLTCRCTVGKPGKQLAAASHYALYPSQEQYFFFSEFNPRSLAWSLHSVGNLDLQKWVVVLDGDAEIVASTCVDMETWRHPMAGLLFRDGERSPGSPLMDVDFPPIHGEPVEDLTPDGMNFSDFPYLRRSVGGVRVSWLGPSHAATKDDVKAMWVASDGSSSEVPGCDADRWKFYPGVQVDQDGTGLHVASLPVTSSGVATLGPIEVAEEGHYVFSVTLKQMKGFVGLYVLDETASKVLARGTVWHEVDQQQVALSVDVRLHPSKAVFLMLENDEVNGKPARFILGPTRCAKLNGLAEP